MNFYKLYKLIKQIMVKVAFRSLVAFFFIDAFIFTLTKHVFFLIIKINLILVYIIIINGIMKTHMNIVML
jgi:hypothetical protein